MSYKDGDAKYAYLALLELAVAGAIFFTGWPLLALAWGLMAVTDLLQFEWTSNPEQYGWAGHNPDLAGLPINVLALVVIIILIFI